MLDAGVNLRDVQIAARHADSRTTMRYDRARKNRDRHPDFVLAAYMSSGHLTCCHGARRAAGLSADAGGGAGDDAVLRVMRTVQCQ
ncbi:MAG: hypothetical protein NVS3B26_18400 [Mycobacteriales bacterium]